MLQHHFNAISYIVGIRRENINQVTVIEKLHLKKEKKKKGVCGGLSAYLFSL